MDITRYFVGLAVLLIATVVPLLSAYWIMLLISSQRRRRLQPGEWATAASVPATPVSMAAGRTRDCPRTPVPVFRLR